MTSIPTIAAKLTKAQREMLLRPDGRYEDSPDDLYALLNAELLGTHRTSLGNEVRTHLQKEASK